jgi:hypothetical protein
MSAAFHDISKGAVNGGALLMAVNEGQNHPERWDFTSVPEA